MKLKNDYPKMKGNIMNQLNFLMTFLLLLFVSVTLIAGPNSTLIPNVEENLIVGLHSDNLGLKTSSAYLLGEYGTSKSVIALMKVLKSGETEEERISAALALTKINTDKARFAVKQRAKFDDSKKVRKFCSTFYQQSLMKN